MGANIPQAGGTLPPASTGCSQQVAEILLRLRRDGGASGPPGHEPTAPWHAARQARRRGSASPGGGRRQMGTASQPDIGIRNQQPTLPDSQSPIRKGRLIQERAQQPQHVCPSACRLSAAYVLAAPTRLSVCVPSVCRLRIGSPHASVRLCAAYVLAAPTRLLLCVRPSVCSRVCVYVFAV